MDTHTHTHTHLLLGLSRALALDREVGVSNIYTQIFLGNARQVDVHVEVLCVYI